MKKIRIELMNETVVEILVDGAAADHMMSIRLDSGGEIELRPEGSQARAILPINEIKSIKRV